MFGNIKRGQLVTESLKQKSVMYHFTIQPYVLVYRYLRHRVIKNTCVCFFSYTLKWRIYS